jgi:phosphoglucosamine mutase
MAAGMAGELAPASDLGRATRLEDAVGRYIEYVKASFPRGLRLDGLRIVVDCANGAAYRVAPTVLHELGADVVPLGVHPDGFNINAGSGSTHPETMAEAVAREGAHIGLALDGDGDRVVMADEAGALLDGDQLLAVIARAWHESGLLRGGAVVATVMSNLGLEEYLRGLGIGLVRTRVGDRYVVERMLADGLNLGGEQSGHIVLSDHATTGDGLLAALQVLAALVKGGGPASSALRPFRPIPQRLMNVPVNGTAPLRDREVKRAIAEAEARLGARGRLLVRASGTEPVVRVMAEGPDEAAVAEVVETLAAAIGGAAAR